MFIARVSKGRTVREFVTAVILIPTLILIPILIRTKTLSVWLISGKKHVGMD